MNFFFDTGLVSRRTFHDITVTATLGETRVDIAPFPIVIVIVEDTNKQEHKILNKSDRAISTALAESLAVTLSLVA